MAGCLPETSGPVAGDETPRTAPAVSRMGISKDHMGRSQDMTGVSSYLAAAASVGTLSWDKALTAAAVLAGVTLLAGLIVILGRKLFAGKSAPLQPGDAAVQATRPDGDFIRSWIAVALVIGLLSFCAYAFAVNDTALRSTLIGGLIASVGTAIAFYFSSKSADKARQDIASAASGTEIVPSLIGDSKDEAAQKLGRTTFRLIDRPGSPPGDHVTEQHPAANTDAPRGSSVQVILGTPPPPPPGGHGTQGGHGRQGPGAAAPPRAGEPA